MANNLTATPVLINGCQVILFKSLLLVFQYLVPVQYYVTVHRWSNKARSWLLKTQTFRTIVIFLNLFANDHPCHYINDNTSSTLMSLTNEREFDTWRCQINSPSLLPSIKFSFIFKEHKCRVLGIYPWYLQMPWHQIETGASSATVLTPLWLWYHINSMAWQWAETLVEIRGTLADIKGTTK